MANLTGYSVSNIIKNNASSEEGIDLGDQDAQASNLDDEQIDVIIDEIVTDLSIDDSMRDDLKTLFIIEKQKNPDATIQDLLGNFIQTLKNVAEDDELSQEEINSSIREQAPDTIENSDNIHGTITELLGALENKDGVIEQDDAQVIAELFGIDAEQAETLIELTGGSKEQIVEIIANADETQDDGSNGDGDNEQGEGERNVSSDNKINAEDLDALDKGGLDNILLLSSMANAQDKPLDEKVEGTDKTHKQVIAQTISQKLGTQDTQAVNKMITTADRDGDNQLSGEELSSLYAIIKNIDKGTDPNEITAMMLCGKSPEEWTRMGNEEKQNILKKVQNFSEDDIKDYNQAVMANDKDALSNSAVGKDLFNNETGLTAEDSLTLLQQQMRNNQETTGMFADAAEGITSTIDEMTRARQEAVQAGAETTDSDTSQIASS